MATEAVPPPILSRRRYTRVAAQELPRMRFNIGGSAAIVVCLCMAAAYVGVLYTLPWSIRRLPRDHPTHILARFLLICIFCALCPFVLAMFYEYDEDSISFAEWLGIRVEGLLPALIIPLVVTAVLFAGSLVASILRLVSVSKQFQHGGMWLALKNSALYYSITHDKLPSLRNYILGPLTEEFVFRSCMVPLLICADFSAKQIILGSPLTFGVAHLHHFVEHLKSGRSIKEALLIVGFQLMYTSLFGAYATFVYLRTGHFISIFLIHIFCNVMGFPDLSFFSPESTLHPFRAVILGTYFAGIYFFSVLLMPLTEPSIYESELWNMTTSVNDREIRF
ncbi:hypothetical protein Poli38472_005960 [Pythium oligandrum]|uniref:intramembrane prenyl-peptidase Rce1 n=1 Tax=Pythium oligandrum TaxID=41045 RepID=A0A8K1FR09_PYTOL|nr:hypothetical protein Poli38472_005960 [Pythium oligandrum]|eukprot:TMW68492.1 hypothetical protein Poli38472_005960 [Pythium oligandrum]